MKEAPGKCESLCCFSMPHLQLTWVPNHLQAALWLWCADLSWGIRHKAKEEAHTEGERHTSMEAPSEPS